MAGDLKTAEWTGGFVPGADPVDRSGHGKGGELGVAGDDGFIGDSLFDVATDRGIDAALERPDQLAGLGGEFVFVEHGDAPAEVVEDDRLCVGFDVDLDLIEAGAATDQRFVEKGFDEGDAGVVALDEDFFFVAKVVVEGRLGDLKTLRQLTHGGAAIALFEEHVGRGLQYSVSLDVLIALTGLKGFPGFVSAFGSVLHVLIVSGWGTARARGFREWLHLESDQPHEFDAIAFGDDTVL
jgi:hypothetical protein